MSKCDNCGKQCGLPYNCSYCGGSFCSDHRLPPSHNCINEARWRNDARLRIIGEGSGNPKRENSPLPSKECFFCGVKTLNTFYCPHCGHDYCSVHKSKENHRCESQISQDGSKIPKTPSKNQNVVVLLVIVAIILGAVCALVVFGNNAESATTNQPSQTQSSSYNPATVFSTIAPVQTEKTIVTITPNFETGATSHTFPYVLRGTSGNIKATLYSGVYNEILSQPSPVWCTRYNSDSSPCTSEETRQYNLKYLDNPVPKKYLDGLIRSIKSKTSNKDDQARIAINLVQQIPYDYSRLYSTNFKGRSPYEVLYDSKGVCGEKSKLLAYLLRELGYGVVLFEFESENHMAVGIKSPVQYSYKNSGYAFIESTSPTIPTDSEGDYIGAGKLTSTPQIIHISDGSSFSSISEEYQDSIAFNRLVKLVEGGETLSPEEHRQYEIMAWKYGVVFSDGRKITEDPSSKPLCGDGAVLCNGKCWAMCYGSNWQCTSQGLVCYY